MTELEEYEQFEATLKKKYPLMFSKPYGGVCVGKGWWNIIEMLCRQIDHWVKYSEDIDPVVILQIKEKFGGLRFYYSGGDDVVYGMVRMAEVWAANTCEVCGTKGTIRTGGWVKTLCDEHEQERKKRDE